MTAPVYLSIEELLASLAAAESAVEAGKVAVAAHAAGLSDRWVVCTRCAPTVPVRLDRMCAHVARVEARHRRAERGSAGAAMVSTGIHGLNDLRAATGDEIVAILSARPPTPAGPLELSAGRDQ